MQPLRLLEPGAVVAEKYRILRVIGRGGLGIVYAAEQLELERPVALKFVTLDGKDAERRAIRLRHEARALARLRSDHTTRVYDVGFLDTTTPFIVMEYLEGRDLGRVIEEDGPVPVERAVDYMLQVADALEEAHSLGIVHRDLKPSNLFLERGPGGFERVKVLDFGIAKHLDQATALTADGALLGSPRYMSPEQLDERSDVDRRTDVWSFGVTLFELVTGNAPFGGSTVAKVCAEIFNAAPPTLTESVQLDELIRGCLQRDRASRPSSMQDVVRQLLPVASLQGRGVGERVLMRPPSGSLSASEPSDVMDTFASDDALARAPAVGVGTENAFTTTARPSGRPRQLRWALGAVVSVAALGAVAYALRSAGDPPAPASRDTGEELVVSARPSAPTEELAAPSPEVSAERPLTPGSASAPQTAPAIVPPRPRTTKPRVVDKPSPDPPTTGSLPTELLNERE